MKCDLYFTKLASKVEQTLLTWLSCFRWEDSLGSSRPHIVVGHTIEMVWVAYIEVADGISALSGCQHFQGGNGNKPEAKKSQDPSHFLSCEWAHHDFFFFFSKPRSLLKSWREGFFFFYLNIIIHKEILQRPVVTIPKSHHQIIQNYEFSLSRNNSHGSHFWFKEKNISKI